jgi:predicted NAD/FAD-binding protein
MDNMRIAIVGSGIAGLACAHALRADADITVFEAEPRLGGHTNTVDVTLEGRTFGVDTGFLVFNQRTYPGFVQLLAELQVPTARSEMSFGLSVALGSGRQLEWAGTNLDTVFAQRRNLVSPAFLRMLAELLRFNAQATQLTASGAAPLHQTLGAFLDANGYGLELRDCYLLPMAAAIWSCPVATMLDYPVTPFLRFCHNHGLLQVTDRPQWYTVRGGAGQYVTAIARGLRGVRLATPVRAVRRLGPGGVAVTSTQGTERFDHVVLACHSDQSLRLLVDADAMEQRLLGACRYQPNRALLHTDTRLLPRARRVWSAWNYLSDTASDAPGERGAPGAARVSVTYLLNRLQPLPVSTPLMVSLNPLREPHPGTVFAEFDYAHPVFDAAAIAAQRRLPQLQGRGNLWFAGAWTGFGFHEDGLQSGLAVAAALRERRAADRRLAA